MKQLKLDLAPLHNDFFEDTRLLGITTTVKNYKLCWLLNNFMGFNFKLNNDIEICLTKRKREYFFNVYESKTNSSTLTHFLYHNHNDGKYLLNEFKHIDFLWLMKYDFVEDELYNNIKAAIKKIKGVQLVVELSPEQIKNKGNMVF